MRQSPRVPLCRVPRMLSWGRGDYRGRRGRPEVPCRVLRRAPQAPSDRRPPGRVPRRNRAGAGGTYLLSFYAHPPSRDLEGPRGPVADARDSLYDLWPRRIPLDLGPEPAYMDVYVAACQVMRPRGDGLGDLGPRKGLAGTAHEEREYLELGRREIQCLPRAADSVAVGIQLQRAELQ